MKPTAPPRTIKRARQLRREMSLPEVLLWQVLRKRPDNLKFRRQHPCGPYIADFYCDALRLVVEVDGEGHSMGQQPLRDVRRDAYLAGLGVETLRVTAVDVLRDMESVITRITRTAQERRPLHRPSDGPPPPLGEELESRAVKNRPPTGEGDHAQHGGGATGA